MTTKTSRKSARKTTPRVRKNTPAAQPVQWTQTTFPWGVLAIVIALLAVAFAIVFTRPQQQVAATKDAAPVTETQTLKLVDIPGSTCAVEEAKIPKEDGWVFDKLNCRWNPIVPLTANNTATNTAQTDSNVKAPADKIEEALANPTPAPTPGPTAEAESLKNAEGIQDQKIQTQGTGKTENIGKWSITFYNGATKQMRGLPDTNDKGEAIRPWQLMKDLNPAAWTEWPNVDMKVAGMVYPASQGAEYGQDTDSYCQQDDRCDVVVPAGEFRLISGDYDMPAVGAACSAKDRMGCTILIVNVGDLTAQFKDQYIDSGFTVRGRYFHGDYLDNASWAILSKTANNMLNMTSKLNQTGQDNAGANCSVREGCSSIQATLVIVSGNEVLVRAVTTSAK